jgi:hypothetical protein
MLHKYPNAGVEFGPGFLEMRPHVAAEIAKCIGLWSDVEFQNAQFLAFLLQATAAPTVAVYLALKNSRTRQDVLAAAARAMLKERDFELFEAIQRIGASLEAQRNDIVHGLYGKSDDIPNGVLWMDPQHRMRHSLALGTIRAEKGRASAEDYLKLKRDIFVYEIADLNALASEIDAYRKNVRLFMSLTSPQTETSANELYHQLCNSPRVREALSQLREGRRKTPQAQP